MAEPSRSLVASLARASPVFAGSHVSAAHHAQPAVFSDYYQLGGTDQPDETEFEPIRKRELKGYTEGPHSPFGLVWQVATATGWTLRYILWRVPYPLLLLMAQDAPRYVSPEQQQRRNMMKMIKNQKKVPEATDPVAFFQTHISKY